MLFKRQAFVAVPKNSFSELRIKKLPPQLITDTLASYYMICGLVKPDMEFDDDDARWELLAKLIPLTAAYPESRETQTDIDVNSLYPAQLEII